MIVEISLQPNCALFANPNSEEAEIQNLILNMLGGLIYSELTENEKLLLKKHGYEP